MGGFPVTENRPKNNSDWFDLYGQPLAEASSSTVTLDTGQMILGAGQVIGGFPLNVKEMRYAKSLVISSTKNIEINVSTTIRTVTGKGTYLGPNMRGWCGPIYGNLTFDLSGQLYDGSIIANIQVFVTGTTETELTGGKYRMSLIYQQAYSDLNFFSQEKMVVFGDSIAWGFTGASTKTGHFVWEIKRLFEKTLNKDLQIINKATSGSSSKFLKYNLENGNFRFSDVGVIIENHCTNDVAQNTTEQEFSDYMDYLIAWKKKFYPQQQMLCLGGTPMQAAASQAASNVLRNIKQTKVQVANDPTIKYLNMGDAYPFATYSYYASSDSNGSAIHPGDTGNAAIIATLNNNWPF